MGDRMVGRNRQVMRPRDARAVKERIGEEEAGETPGQSRLADALLPADDPGLRQTPRAIGLKQLPLGGVMADKQVVVTRMGRILDAIAFGHALVRTAFFHAVRALASIGPSRSCTTAHMAFATSSGPLAASTTAHRPGSPLAMSRKAAFRPS